jgi:hypothetical protein
MARLQVFAAEAELNFVATIGELCARKHRHLLQNSLPFPTWQQGTDNMTY